MTTRPLEWTSFGQFKYLSPKYDGYTFSCDLCRWQKRIEHILLLFFLKMTPWIQFGTESTAGVVFGPWNLENNENPWHYDSYRIRHSGCMLTRFMIFRSICSRINFVFNLKQTFQNVSSIILKLGLVPMTSTWKKYFRIISLRYCRNKTGEISKYVLLFDRSGKKNQQLKLWSSVRSNIWYDFTTFTEKICVTLNSFPSNLPSLLIREKWQSLSSIAFLFMKWTIF